MPGRSIGFIHHTGRDTALPLLSTMWEKGVWRACEREPGGMRASTPMRARGDEGFSLVGFALASKHNPHKHNNPDPTHTPVQHNPPQGTPEQTHMPLLQISFCPHALPQAPQ